MAVPGTPSLIVRNKSASAFPCFFRARVRSGPRPPPRAPSPWQNAQLARNSNSPSFAALESLASGFLSCARTEFAARKCATARIARTPIYCRGVREKAIPILPPAWSTPKICPHYTTARRKSLRALFNKVGTHSVLCRRHGGQELSLAFRQVFSPHPIGVLGNFVIDLLDFQSKLKIMRISRIFLEQRVPLVAQVSAFFLPKILACQRGVAHATSVDAFWHY